MGYIYRYKPTFVDFADDEKNKFHFESKQELLDIPFVKKFSEENNFVGYALSPDSKKTALMAVYDDGYKWWVIGFIEDVSGIDLPEWKSKYR